MTEAEFRRKHHAAKGVGKERVAEWWNQWVLAGRPSEWPDYKDWWASPAADKRREYEAIWTAVRNR
jgi:hypothetical protein